MQTSADLLQIIIRIVQSDSACTESFNICVGELVSYTADVSWGWSYQDVAVQIYVCYVCLRLRLEQFAVYLINYYNEISSSPGDATVAMTHFNVNSYNFQS
jgi:hypothetical protein